MESAPSPHKSIAASSARVIETSRRFITLKLPSSEKVIARATTKALEAVVGDLVTYSSRGEDIVVDAILPRRNKLERRYGAQLKPLAANLDLLIIVSAVAPLFNVSFIDRISLAATTQQIPFVLLLNKIDLGIEETVSLLSVYEKLDVPLIQTSAVTGEGLKELQEILASGEKQCVALAGVSGVGKSTLINLLVPEAFLKTNRVSTKTGQGRQTTSQSTAYDYTLPKGGTILMIDLPGSSTFGLSYLSREEVRQGFIEFAPYSRICQYSDCFHIEEPQCAVKNALETGEISYSRYASYLDILQEIEAARPY